MASDLYWIDSDGPWRLAIMARPRAGDWLDDELAHWERSGVTTVVSLLEREEVQDLGLEVEPDICARRGIEFLTFPIEDRGVPEDRVAMKAFVRGLASRDGAIAIHCRAGIGRSSLIAAAIMIARGMVPARALETIQAARGLPVPDTDAQRNWILGFEID